MDSRGMSYTSYGTEEKRDKFNPENTKILKEFLEYCVSKGLSKETITQYKNRIECFFVYLLDNKDNKSFIDLTKKDVILWQGSRIASGKSSSNIRQSRAALSSMSNYVETVCDEEYQNYRNIINKIPAPKAEQKREKTFLTEDEIIIIENELLKREEYEKLAYLSLAFDSGSRKNEIHQVLKDIDWDKHQTKLVIGKGGKKFTLAFSKKTEEYIKLYLKDRGEDDCQFLFVIKKKEGNVKQISKNTINTWCSYFSEILKELIGKDVVIYPHALRGSRGNSLYKTKGINIETIQALLHHSDSGTTMKSYIEHNDEDTNNLIFGDYKTQEEE